MKKILFIVAMAASTATYAQEEEKTETVVTKTTITNDTGEKVNTKSEIKTVNQDVVLVPTGDNTNFEAVALSKEVDTKVTYTSKDYNYTMVPKNNGFNMMQQNEGNEPSMFARFMPTSQKGYFLVDQNGQNALAYYNREGSLVIERYDAKSDTMVTTTYKSNMSNK